MFAVSRKCAFVLLAALALAATGCGSNNAGKIEGKWKIVTITRTSDAKAKQVLDGMSALGVYLFMEFKPDGVLEFGIGSDKPGALELVKLMTKGEPLSATGKYKLLKGDGVDTLTLTDAETNATFARVK
jgi:hypothetical protein